MTDCELTSASTKGAPETDDRVHGHLSHAEELRALGQLLEMREFAFVALEATESGYKIEAQVDERKQTVHSLGAIVKRFFSNVGSFHRNNRQSTTRKIELRYNAQEIEQLIQDGIARRQPTNTTPDPFSLSNILRSVGAYLDGFHHATLIHVAVEDRWITVRYRQGSGSVKELKQDIQFYYDYWVKMYLHRSERSLMLSPTDATYRTR